VAKISIRDDHKQWLLVVAKEGLKSRLFITLILVLKIPRNEFKRCLKMDIDEADFDYDDELEVKYQISYTSGKPAPMQNKKRLSPWQRIELLKDEAKLNRQLANNHFDFYD
jgi:hypothetical protein